VRRDSVPSCVRRRRDDRRRSATTSSETGRRLPSRAATDPERGPVVNLAPVNVFAVDFGPARVRFPAAAHEGQGWRLGFRDVEHCAALGAPTMIDVGHPSRSPTSCGATSAPRLPRSTAHRAHGEIVLGANKGTEPQRIIRPDIPVSPRGTARRAGDPLPTVRIAAEHCPSSDRRCRAARSPLAGGVGAGQVRRPIAGGIGPSRYPSGWPSVDGGHAPEGSPTPTRAARRSRASRAVSVAVALGRHRRSWLEVETFPTGSSWLTRRSSWRVTSVTTLGSFRDHGRVGVDVDSMAYNDLAGGGST